MRLKDDKGNLLVLEADTYCDDLGTTYGIIVSIAGADKGFLLACIHEEDALQMAVDLDGGNYISYNMGVERTIRGVCCLQYKSLPGWDGIELSLECEDETNKCMLSKPEFAILRAWLDAYKTFCENRLNETDSILPNQTYKTTKYSFSMN